LKLHPRYVPGPSSHHRGFHVLVAQKGSIGRVRRETVCSSSLSRFCRKSLCSARNNPQSVHLPFLYTNRSILVIH
jgi:hypothetical protein